MPTVKFVGPYRLFFYSGNGAEPVHIHVEREDKIAKFWLRPVRLARGGGFSGKELSRIQKIVEDDEEELIGAWNEYFNQ